MRRRVRGATVSLTGLMSTTSRGRTYWYYRRKGQPLVKLPAPDEPGFLAAYEAARDSAPGPKPLRLPLGSIDALCEAAMSSDRFLSGSAVYRKTLRRHFEAIRRDAGSAPAKGLRDYMVRANVVKAASPVDRLKAWRFLAAFGVDANLLAVDPTLGVKADRQETDGHEPWTPDDEAAFRERWLIGTTKRLGFEVVSWAGCRIGDAVMTLRRAPRGPSGRYFTRRWRRSRSGT